MINSKNFWIHRLRIYYTASKQCSGSMTFWGGTGSGSTDPCLRLMDPDSDPAIFVIDLQDASKKLIFNKIFPASYFLKVHLHHFSKIKSQKESQNRRNQGFSYYFCMMIEGSGSGSIPRTSGSGSGRPKNMWIRWIRIRIRIRNTASKHDYVGQIGILWLSYGSFQQQIFGSNESTDTLV